MRTIFFSILFVVSITANANDSSAMLTEGRKWVYKELLPDYENMTEEQIRNGEVPYSTSYHSLLVGKTVSFENKRCHEILHCKDNTEILFGYAYEEERKVFFYALYADDVEGFSQPISCEKNQWQLLYDFNATLGMPSEMVWLWSGFSLIKKDVVNVKSRQYTRQTWKSTDNVICHIVEGIGCETGFLYVENITTNGASTQFVECRENGVCIFSNKDFEVASITESVKSARYSPYRYNLYDLQGHRLLKEPTHGVYIQNGMKRIK
jgi:hypothetical protein